MSQRKRILFVTERAPSPYCGHDQRIALQCQALAEMGDVDGVVVSDDERFMEDWPAEGHGRPVLRLPSPPIEKNLGRFFDGNPGASIYKAVVFKRLDAMYRHTPDALAAFGKLQPGGYDMVFFNLMQYAWCLDWGDPSRSVIDIDDLPSQRFKAPEGATMKQRVLGWLRHRHAHAPVREALDRHRLLLVCSELDRRELGERENVAVAPNGYWHDAAMDQKPGADAPGGLLFVGTFDYAPNRDGMRWFSREVWPAVRAKHPEAKLRIVGGLPAKFDPPWAGAEGVEHLGRVEHLGPVVRDAQLTICPLLEGYGTRIKILESLAYGKPVVSTTIGAFGHPMREDMGVFRCDEPEAFAAACVRLLSDDSERSRLGEAGRSFVRDRYSPAAIKGRLQALMAPILGV